LLNNDTRAAPQWLSELKRTLDENPSAGFCSSKMLFADQPDVINSVGIGFTRAGTAFDVGYGEKDGDRFTAPRPIFGACAGAAMYRRKVFDDVGLFDEDLFMWYEDADLSFRAQLAGYGCRFVPTAIVYHIGGGTASPNHKSHIFYCSRNQILILAKNLPDALRVHYFSRLILICLKHLFKTLLRGETTVLRGYLAALKDLKYFIRKGKLTSYKTVASVQELSRLLKMDSYN
ncbi:MAG: glycosyltransferase family 2 protein, partial [Candidatus Lindowbacteria bacterium]|nr:glycosyltransferase family 2 protein [Candidatus Lindowbacteria bacterium]